MACWGSWLVKAIGQLYSNSQPSWWWTSEEQHLKTSEVQDSGPWVGSFGVRPAQKSRPQVLPCLAQIFQQTISISPPLGSLSGFGSKSLLPRKALKHPLSTSEGAQDSMKRKREKIQWYVKSRASTQRNLSTVGLKGKKSILWQGRAQYQNLGVAVSCVLLDGPTSPRPLTLPAWYMGLNHTETKHHWVPAVYPRLLRILGACKPKTNVLFRQAHPTCLLNIWEHQTNY